MKLITFFLTSVSLTAEELDNLLVRLEIGMDIALTWAKAWSKYTKEILNYVERRAQLGGYIFVISIGTN